MSFCRFCGVRWAQERGSCRLCKRLGMEDRLEAERAQVAALEAQEMDAYLRTHRRQPGPPPREVVIDGQAYIVVFDGALREPEAIH